MMRWYYILKDFIIFFRNIDAFIEVDVNEDMAMMHEPDIGQDILKMRNHDAA